MAEIITFGCRLNAFESQIIKEKLEQQDDVIVVNTCAVTSEASRQCKQKIRKLRKENPDKKIVVTGCAVQVNPDEFYQMPEVDLVLGNVEKIEIENYIQKTGEFSSDIFADYGYDKHIITGFEGKHKAFVQIQNGCNHFCTYCIIPYARGKSQSIQEAHIIDQINKLVEEGFEEVCLTGVDICSYEPSLKTLIKNILNQTKLKKLALGSLDPETIDDEFISILDNDRILPYFHLSIQSLDDMVLKRMKRRHSVASTLDICDKLHKIKDAKIGADFICGFPTETDEQFANTLSNVKKASIDQLHVFPYSIRNGTPAALMPQVNKETIHKRAKELRDVKELG
ncbi:MAG: tRNA (N(6)-L-threonylcarbamoyladenosine(37)-C(2))-methylthiotransferase MtaB [Alphaproteobacteria bacterium]